MAAIVAPFAVPAATPASQPSVEFRVRDRQLSRALTELARQADITLIFSDVVVGRRTARPLQGRRTPDAALSELLAGSDLDFRKTPDGSFVIFAKAVPAPPHEDQAIPEILVVGRRTQNTDIRRSINDIQAYHVANSEDIASAHDDTIDEFLRTRLSSNANPVSPTQDPNGQAASPRSQIDLHGLGQAQTLVLIDGRRMPDLPTTSRAPVQPDLNALPLSAIDRIEVLASSAGGIYGPGATGGVVNVVLKRDYRGAEFSMTYGVTERGDAPRTQLAGRIGFTPDGGRTDVMLSFGRSAGGPLSIGDRDFLYRARARAYGNDPSLYLQDMQIADAVTITSLSGNLTLKPAYGDGTLPSTVTFAPIGYRGIASDGAAVLRANAGIVPLTPSPDDGGAKASLLTQPSTTSVLVNIRHRFSDSVEVFADMIGLDDRGIASATVSPQAAFILSSAPTNPFNQPIQVAFPLPGFGTTSETRIRSVRATAGVIVKLPHGWRADLDYGLGQTRQKNKSVGSLLGGNSSTVMLLGVPGPGGTPLLDPLGDWSTFLDAAQAYRRAYSQRDVLKNGMADANVRLGGPLMALPGGMMSLTLLAEDRHESEPASMDYGSFAPAISPFPHLHQYVRSFYAEARAPFIPMDSASILRGLELQVAVRHDRNTFVLPADFTASAANSKLVTTGEGATVYTAGLRFFPLPMLMLRSSIATGVLLPTIDQISSSSMAVTEVIFPGTDPERGGRAIGSEGSYTLVSGGSLALRPERARSVSLGAVLNPNDARRPRISLDYTLIRKTGEISEAHAFDLQYFLDNESRYPDRITRAPLTAADMALGFTGGVVTGIDTTALNIGRTKLGYFDLQLDYPIPIRAGAQLRLYGSASWQPLFKTRPDPDQPWYTRVGYVDGPLEWRGNGGFEWRRGPFEIGVNAQYYGHYRVGYSNPAIGSDFGQINELQGATWIPAQVYFDLAASYRFTVRNGGFPRTLDLRMGIQNVLDHSPPIVANPFGSGYSFYGDPRLRRFQMAITTHF